MTSRTTIGHGILSQYNPDALKQWQTKENRRMERSTSPVRPFNPKDSFYTPSIVPTPQPAPLAPIEQLHNAMPRPLSSLQQLKNPPHLKNGGRPAPLSIPNTSQTPSLPSLGPLNSPSSPVSPQARALPNHHYRAGPCQHFNQKVHSKASLITSRRP